MTGVHKSNNSPRELMSVGELLALFPSASFDAKSADIYGRLRADLERAGESIGGNDLMIAAIALANDLTLVTHNTAEFSRVPSLLLEDWQ